MLSLSLSLSLPLSRSLSLGLFGSILKHLAIEALVPHYQDSISQLLLVVYVSIVRLVIGWPLMANALPSSLKHTFQA